MGRTLFSKNCRATGEGFFASPAVTDSAVSGTITSRITLRRNITMANASPSRRLRACLAKYNWQRGGPVLSSYYGSSRKCVSGFGTIHGYAGCIALQPPASHCFDPGEKSTRIRRINPYYVRFAARDTSKMACDGASIATFHLPTSRRACCKRALEMVGASDCRLRLAQLMIARHYLRAGPAEDDVFGPCQSPDELLDEVGIAQGGPFGAGGLRGIDCRRPFSQIILANRAKDIQRLGPFRL